MTKTLILGLGNDILCDDGIGMRLAKDLQKLGTDTNFTPDFSFLPASIDGLELLEVMDGYDKVFIIDAFKTIDMEIGEIAVLGVEDLSHSIYIGSPHSLNLATAIKLNENLHYKIPKEIIIIAVNVFDTQTFSENLSPQLQEKYPDILNKVKEIIVK